MRTIFLALSSLGILIVGCGGSVEVGNSSGGTSGSGGGATSSATTSSATSSTASSTGSGGVSCGGELGTLCGKSELCLFGDGQCGGNDGLGMCVSRPADCDDTYMPVCACDGKTYDNPCEAAGSGFDVNVLGGCPPPMGMFGCGSGFCMAGAQYCEHDVKSVGTVTQTWSCKALPPPCGNPPTCACFANVMCGKTCTPTADGGFMVICETP